MSGMYAVDAEYMRPDKSFTMGHSFKLKKERKKDQWKISGNNILNSWNMLPAEVVSAPSLDSKCI